MCQSKIKYYIEKSQPIHLSKGMLTTPFGAGDEAEHLSGDVFALVFFSR